MSYQNISVSYEQRVMLLTINRPDKMNALNPATHLEMAQALDEFESNDELWVAIITGAGDAAFCAGGDLAAMQDAASSGDAEKYQVPQSGYGGLTNRFSCDKPIIAAVNGFAAGGGFEIVMSCDLAVASENASFGLPEPRVGVVAVASGLHRLPRSVGNKRAMEILLTGDFIDANTALQWGLINQVVAPGELLDAARALANRIVKCSPVAIRATKQAALRGLDNPSIEDAVAAQERGDYPALEAWKSSADTQEGINAFVEKRRPQWQNR